MFQTQHTVMWRSWRREGQMWCSFFPSLQAKQGCLAEKCQVGIGYVLLLQNSFSRFWCIFEVGLWVPFLVTSNVPCCSLFASGDLHCCSWAQKLLLLLHWGSSWCCCCCCYCCCWCCCCWWGMKKRRKTDVAIVCKLHTYCLPAE